MILRVREVKSRMSSIQGVRKMTKAMKLVASAKLRRAQRMQVQATPFADAMHSMTRNISKHLGPDAPMLWRRRAVNRLDVFAIMSERGLCGGFNERLFCVVSEQIEIHRRHNIDVTLFGIGKRSKMYWGEGVQYLETDQDKDVAVAEIAKLAIDRFIEGKSDGAIIAFNRFRSALVQEPGYWDVVPLHWRGSKSERGRPYGFEPCREEVLNKLAVKAIFTTIKQAIIESQAAELAARLTAMDKATKSADEIAAMLNREYYKARQAAITNDLMGIVSGAELLKVTD